MMADLARSLAVELLGLGVVLITVALYLTALAASEALRRRHKVR